MSGGGGVRISVVVEKLQEGHTLAVVAKGHFGLAEADGVFALGDAIELLELCLVDALEKVLLAEAHLWRAGRKRWGVKRGMC